MKVLAEFETREGLVHAARELRARGRADLDAFTPYPSKEVEEALGLRRSRLPFAAFAAGMAGAAAAYFVQWWCNASDYPIDVGGRPLHSGLAWVPISFEMGILGAALAIVGGLFWSAGLPALWRPEMEVDGFERATIDRFWLAVAADPRELADLGARRVVPFGGPS